MIKRPGRQPTILDARIIRETFLKISHAEVVIHHITEDSSKRLQVVYEVRRLVESNRGEGVTTKCSFHRTVFE